MRAVWQDFLKLARLWVGLWVGLCLAGWTPCVALAADPDLQRGLACLNSGQAQQALAALTTYAQRCRCAEGEFLTGRALLEFERPQSALVAFQAALALDPRHLPARLHATLALEKLERWEEAARELRLALAADLADSLRRDVEQRLMADGERHKLQQAGARLPAPRRLGDKVNSPADDFMPLLSLDGRHLWFTSNRPGGLDPQGRGCVFREDFWRSERTGPDWGTARLVDPPFNTAGSEGSGSFSADGRLFVFSACGRPSGGDCDLFLSEWTAGGWSLPRPLARLNSPGWESQPALAPDGTWLLFASDRPGGLGGQDLWLARRDADGQFGAPQNAAPLNTAGQEAGPFLHADGYDLYFSSDGRIGFGGLDLFHSRLAPDGSWSAPRNLGPPFSTAQPDLGLCLSADARTALFSSRRDARPDLDLYESQVPACCPPDPVFQLTGRVVDAASGRPLAARVKLESLEPGNSTPGERLCDADGLFTCVLVGGRHLLFADAPDHLFACQPVLAGEAARTDGGPKSWRASADTLLVRLQPLEAGAHLALPMVRFAFNRAELRPDGLPVLEQVLAWLQARPGTPVELRGHTDDVGSDLYNLELSQRRAQAVKDWLVARGVPEMQISTRGLGMREPLRTEAGEAARAANRRTELWLQ